MPNRSGCALILAVCGLAWLPAAACAALWWLS